MDNSIFKSFFNFKKLKFIEDCFMFIAKMKSDNFIFKSET